MDNRKRLAQLLCEAGGYRDLDTPAILTSGELGIYYVNTEKLLQDNGEFEKHGSSSEAVIRHAISMRSKSPVFDEAVRIIAEETSKHFPDNVGHICRALSGGQRRDWIFSGPTAAELGIRHISLYKDGSMEALGADMHRDLCPTRFSEAYCVHVVDMLTTGSSAYRIDNGKERGWIPMLRRFDTSCDTLVSVVSRKQGGEEMLQGISITTDSLVSIDDEFLHAHSQQPTTACAYLRDPRAWAENYIINEGIGALAKEFDPARKKDDRAERFLERYYKTLMESGRYDELDRTLRKEYGLFLYGKEVLTVGTDPQTKGGKTIHYSTRQPPKPPTSC